MATISFTNLTVSGNMGFKEISFDAFRRILDFIEAQTHGAIPAGTDLNDLCAGTWKEAAETSPVCPDVNNIPDAEKDAPREAPYEFYFLDMPHYKGADKVKDIFCDAHAHPEKYTQEYRTSAQFKADYPSLSGISLHSVAHTLGWMNGNVPDCQKSYDYDESLHLYVNRYLVPVPVLVKKDTIGSRIHKARRENGFLATELADLLGYSDALLTKWEKDELVPSSEAMENLKKALGDDLFDGLEV